MQAKLLLIASFILLSSLVGDRFHYSFQNTSFADGSFRYRNIKVSSKLLPHDGHITISADIKNTGKFDGDEVVQLYVRFIDSKVERPQKELKGFAGTHIKAGETQTVTITLKGEDLAYWNEKRRMFVVETGKVELQLGSSSADIRLKKTITVSRRIITE